MLIWSCKQSLYFCKVFPIFDHWFNCAMTIQTQHIHKTDTCKTKRIICLHETRCTPFCYCFASPFFANELTADENEIKQSGCSHSIHVRDCRNGYWFQSLHRGCQYHQGSTPSYSAIGLTLHLHLPRLRHSDFFPKHIHYCIQPEK